MIHPHVHLDYSNYGMQDSVNRLDNVIVRLKELGQTAWCCTDHGTMSGIVAAYKASKKAGIKLIPGMEGYYTEDLSIKQRGLSHITFWAKSNKGLHNLNQLTSEAHGDKGLSPDNYYFKSRVDLSLIRKYSTDIMVGTACLGSFLAKPGGEEVLVQLIDIFGDDVFLELHTYQCEEQYEYNRKLIEYAKKYNLHLIVATDAHFTWKHDHDLHKHFKNTSKVQEGDEHLNETLYIQSADEIRSNLSYLPSDIVELAIANTQILSDRSDVTIDFDSKHYPHYPCDDPYETVRQKCLQGWDKKIVGSGVNLKVYADRVKHELSVLKAQDYCSYFLITEGYLSKARNKGIPVGPGRGSVVASLVAYLMGITAIDPIKYNMTFERFAHNERSAPPDIDCDLGKKRRHEVIEDIKEDYGDVYQVRTFAVIGASGAIRRAGDALHWDKETINALAKSISKYESEDDEEEEISSYDQKIWVLDNIRTEENKELIDLAKRFVGIISGYGKHASAVLILDSDVTKFCSVERQMDSKTGKPCYIAACAYPLLEAMGLMKADVLSLKMLDVIHDTIEMSGQNIDISKIPLNDITTSEMLCEGNTSGCFQIESPGMTKLVKGIKPQGFADLIPLVALYRPGPLDAIVEETGDTMVETYVKVRNGEIEATYLHEKLRPILEETYGIILYQEQILEIVKSLCGYSLGEADMLRRIIGKKKIDEMKPAIDTMIERGVSNGIPRDIMEAIAERIVTFALYGFNKGHSGAYGLVAYQTSYLKAHLQIYYMCAVINSEEDVHDNIIPYIKECKKLGITVLPPDISKANREWVIEGDAIRMGLHYIKGIGGNLKLDDVSSYEAVKSSNNKGVKAALVKAGALDCFGMSRISMLVDVSQTEQGIAKAELNIAKNSESIIKLTADNESKKDKTTKVYTENQRKIKKYTDDIPNLQGKLKEAQQAHEALKCYENVIGEIEVLGYSDGIKPNVKLGKLTNVFSKIVSNGSTMGWVTLKSDYGEFRCSAFEDHWNTFKDLISVGSQYLFVCKETSFGFNLVEISVNGKVYAAPKKSYGKRG